jgi:hypothetical protein
VAFARGLPPGEHVLGVAAVIAEAGNFLLRAIGEITATAEEAGAVVSAMPADADALALLPVSDAGSEFGDDSGNFVAGGARVRYAGP